jgi:hypothetical protein
MKIKNSVDIQVIEVIPEEILSVAYEAVCGLLPHKSRGRYELNMTCWNRG